jgi:ABC-type transport system involved in cytochrome bd biosynthesis fused ATPase/permease subunit
MLLIAHRPELAGEADRVVRLAAGAAVAERERQVA